MTFVDNYVHILVSFVFIFPKTFNIKLQTLVHTYVFLSLERKKEYDIYQAEKEWENSNKVKQKCCNFVSNVSKHLSNHQTASNLRPDHLL